MTSETLLVGLGSSHGDDQFGWRVAEGLAARGHADVDVRLARAPSQLLDWLDGVRNLVVCDACQGLGAVGTVGRWEWPAPQLAFLPAAGSHGLGLVATLALAEQLGRLPPSVVIWMVQAGALMPAGPMSPLVAATVSRVVKRIERELTEKGSMTEVR